MPAAIGLILAAAKERGVRIPIYRDEDGTVDRR
jgi:hypothetical protein